MRSTTPLLCLAIVCLLAVPSLSFGQSDSEPIQVVLDTDANNELDDQHASLPRDVRALEIYGSRVSHRGALDPQQIAWHNEAK